VVISVDTAARQAAARGVPIVDELRFLLAHGVLHLLGYDHERSPAEARRMFATQRRLLRRLGTED
jgi:rRNA maturation RNase YbeY